MSIRKFFFQSLTISAVLALFYRLFIKTFASGVPQKPLPGSTAYDSIDAFVAEQMRRLNIPGAALAIVEGDRIVHQRGFGRARPNGEAPSPQTPFFIGSLTKSFTALAVMQLVESGKIELDAPVQRYLPWFRVADPQASAQMTVRHLLNQTSSLPVSLGLADLARFDNSLGAAEQQVRALSTLTPKRPVGAKFEYSNSNYNILGLIVETASGESYANYIQRHIFDPLKMRHSYTSKAAARQDGLAMGYRYWFGIPIPAPDLPVPNGSLASGQLISTMEDMGHYLIANLNGGRYGEAQILSEAGIDELQRPAAEIIEMGMKLGYYGMGWISEGSGAARIVSHSGDVPDFGAFMALVPAQKKGLVLLLNANHAMMKITYDEVGMGAAQRLAGVPPTPFKFDALPWMQRGLLLIPLLQILGVVITLGQLGRWRRDPALHPSSGRMWRQYILLPLIPNLVLAATPLLLLRSKMRGFIRFFMPDVSLLALVCGSFAGIWAFLRTALILRTLRKAP
jgi:CubicO group peptidase (beta-lactamase class C family)